MKKEVFYHFWKPERIATPIPELLFRLNLYAEAYTKKSRGNTLNVLIKDKDLSHVSHPNTYTGINFVVVHYARNNVVNLFRMQKRIRHICPTPSLFIPNDPYRSFALMFLLKAFFFNGVKIQLQLHGTIPRGFALSLRTQAMRSAAVCAILLSHSIRTVSESDFKRLSSFQILKKKEIFYAPVPVSLPYKFKGFSNTRIQKNIIFLGRIHEERGIDMLIEVVKACNFSNSNHVFHIVGDGPRLTDLKHKLETQTSDGSCVFYGEIHGEGLINVLQDMDALLSCAPKESYGLAMREALMEGVPVIALANDATHKLKVQFKDHVALFESVSEAVRLLFDQVESLKISEEQTARIRETLFLENLANIDSVAKSWII